VLRPDGRHAEILETVQKLLDEHDVAGHEFPEIALQTQQRLRRRRRDFLISLPFILGLPGAEGPDGNEKLFDADIEAAESEKSPNSTKESTTYWYGRL